MAKADSRSDAVRVHLRSALDLAEKDDMHGVFERVGHLLVALDDLGFDAENLFSWTLSGFHLPKKEGPSCIISPNDL